MLIRKAARGDEGAILDLIKELAVFENEPNAVINTKEQLTIDLFDLEVCEAFVCVIRNQIIGFALFYTSYSTWRGSCLYLEDLYVKEEHRREGAGKALFEHVIKEAKNRNYKRLDWQVLEWNTPAIDFYKKFDADFDAEWLNGRLYFN